ncbi:NADAR family protein [Tenacibaculum sp. TC6]|uniref:NADAR family protein n=1 Tax=Tenacibaculum sp. TC6 TaxID=3423223 RepID=UPI003D36CB85
MNPSVREYQAKNVITFAKTNGPYGAFSNMAPEFNLFVNEINIQSSEILYQACRFPLFPNIQEEIVRTQNPMDAKKISRQYIQYSRQDWDNVKFKIMKWCLEVKLVQNFDKFSDILYSTDNKVIVEYSKKDTIWGATFKDKTTLVGKNALGRLLMELREKVKIKEITKSTVIFPPNIPAFLLFGNLIEEIRNDEYFILDLDEIYI